MNVANLVRIRLKLTATVRYCMSFDDKRGGHTDGQMDALTHNDAMHCIGQINI